MHVIKTYSLALKTNFSYLNTFVRFSTDLEVVSLCNDLYIVSSLDVCCVTYIPSFCVIIILRFFIKIKLQQPVKQYIYTFTAW